MPTPQTLEISPVTGPLDATTRVPGSKSLTNRALVCAALADGPSQLDNVLFADDTEAMVACLDRLAIPVESDRLADQLVVEGCGGQLPAGAAGATLDARMSGTTARFLLPVLALGQAPTRLDGAAGLRSRPMADGIAALRALGAAVDEEGAPGHLPVTVRGAATRDKDPQRDHPNEVSVSGEISSQFLSGLLLSAPAHPKGLRVTISGALVSRPYVDMTAAVMAAFGVSVARDDGSWTVAPAMYRGTRYMIEPDASAASYMFAAAALCGGRVTVDGLHRDSLQGDLAFTNVLERMGCRTVWGRHGVTVERANGLRGVDVDLSDLSDTAQTLAAVAVFAESPTRIRGIGFIRHKETDRVGNVVRELRRCGIRSDEEPDGFTVYPGRPRPARVETYGDHRMAMSFALLGLRAPGIEITDPQCVAKTFPRYWDALRALR
jgi:3-phosphoshikimate 1-carboxyvinyltransferase